MSNIGGGQGTVAVMEDVGDGEIVVERGHDKNDARQQHGGERGDSSAAGSFTETSRRGVLTEQCQKACQERVRAQPKRQQQRKASDLRHRRNPTVPLQYFFKEADGMQTAARQLPTFLSTLGSLYAADLRSTLVCRRTTIYRYFSSG